MEEVMRALASVYYDGLKIDSLHTLANLLDGCTVDKEEFKKFVERSFVMNKKENFPFTLEKIDRAVRSKGDSEVQTFKAELMLIFDKLPFDHGSISKRYLDENNVVYYIDFNSYFNLLVFNYSVDRISKSMPIEVYGADKRLNGLRLGFLRLNSDYGYKLENLDSCCRLKTNYGDIYELSTESYFKHYWMYQDELYRENRFEQEDCRKCILMFYQMLKGCIPLNDIKEYTLEASKVCSTGLSSVIKEVLG